MQLDWKSIRPRDHNAFYTSNLLSKCDFACIFSMLYWVFCDLDLKSAINSHWVTIWLEVHPIDHNAFYISKSINAIKMWDCMFIHYAILSILIPEKCMGKNIIISMREYRSVPVCVFVLNSTWSVDIPTHQI